MKFKIASFLGLFILFSNIAFAGLTDIDGYRFYTSIDSLHSMGIVSGYPDETFRPGKMINRAELTKMVIEGFYYGPFDDYSDDNCFTDVNKEDWFSEYVCFAKSEGILDGYSDGSFGPGNNITQPEALKIIYNSLGETVPESEGEWYDMYLNYSEDFGMYYFNTDSPADYKIKRGEIAYFINWLSDTELYDQITYKEFYEDGVDFSYNDNYEEHSYYYDDFDYDETFATYSINKDDIDLLTGIGASGHQEIWDYFAELIPYKYRENLIEFVVFTDGADGILAMVDGWLYYDDKSEPSYDEWILNVDIEDAFKDSKLHTDIDDIYGLTYTLIHEFGHLFTLNLEQVTPVEWYTEEEYQAAFDTCEGVFIRDGCAHEDSYISDFHKEFWTDIYEEWYELQYILDDDEYYYSLYDFYLNHEDEFVDDYAATDIGEDIAETFAYFVVQDKPDGCKISEEKMLFFYDYDEFVELRDSIRSAI